MQQVIIPECAPHLAIPKLTDFSPGRHARPKGKDNEWFTPAFIVEVARATMGGIDLDPSSCSEANAVVKAKQYYTIDDNGWTKEWHGRVFLNPPYNGTIPGDGGRAVSNKCAFIDKLVAHYAAGEVTQACLVCVSDFSPRWGQGIRQHATAICFSVGRWPFWKADDDKVESAGHGSMLVYFGPNTDRFAVECHRANLGLIMVPHQWQHDTGGYNGSTTTY